MKNIVLTGFMGTGKTCVGRILAQELGWPFVDLDVEVEKLVGMTIADYFNLAGEAAFRDREQETVAKVSVLSHVVLATGGGVVLRQANIDRLRETGVLVCLSASEQEIIARTSGDILRPLLNRPDRLQVIKELLAARLPLYRQSDIWVETGGRTAAEIAAGILRILQEEGWLHGDPSGGSRIQKL
jgi:shikimate kinase